MTTARTAATAPTRLLARNPGASTSNVRSPAWAAFPAPSTTERVRRFGAASTTAMPRVTSRHFQRPIRLSANQAIASGSTVNANP